MRILVTGSEGFIAGYLVAELLAAGHSVVGLDNFSKYGEVRRSYADHPNYLFYYGDATDPEVIYRLLQDCDVLVAAAARIGGITYFHQYAFDLLAENEQIMAATYQAAIRRHKEGSLKRVVVLSSSMVFENATVFPTPEGHERECPPPTSTYGFQKLACEYFARGAWEQYEIPYTIIRPFNCVGIGEQRAIGGKPVMSGNIELAMSHVVPDLCQKLIKGQDPLHILGDGQQLRHYTYGGDLARGIRMAIESEVAINEDFNLSTEKETTVLELAMAICRRVRGNDVPLRYVSDSPFPHDVQVRSPDVRKARELLGFEAKTSLDIILDEVVPWVTEAVRTNQI